MWLPPLILGYIGIYYLVYKYLKFFLLYFYWWLLVRFLDGWRTDSNISIFCIYWGLGHNLYWYFLSSLENKEYATVVGWGVGFMAVRSCWLVVVFSSSHPGWLTVCLFSQLWRQSHQKLHSLPTKIKGLCLCISLLSWLHTFSGLLLRETPLEPRPPHCGGLLSMVYFILFL